jgi:hypothetical protein
MKTRPVAITLLIASLIGSHNLRAQDTKSAGENYRMIQRLAIKWYGEGTKIREVREWKAIRITAQGYDTYGERRWLVLFPEAPIGSYNAVIVSMMIDSKHNDWITMSEQARKALLTVSKLTRVSGVSVDNEMNDLGIPYLLQTFRSNSTEWTKGTYYVFPVENVSEYMLDLKAKDPNADSIPEAASVYMDENNFLVHRKITSTLTISRGPREPTRDK